MILTITILSRKNWLNNCNLFSEMAKCAMSKKIACLYIAWDEDGLFGHINIENIIENINSYTPITELLYASMINAVTFIPIKMLLLLLPINGNVTSLCVFFSAFRRRLMHSSCLFFLNLNFNLRCTPEILTYALILINFIPRKKWWK